MNILGHDTAGVAWEDWHVKVWLRTPLGVRVVPVEKRGRGTLLGDEGTPVGMKMKTWDHEWK